MKNLILLLILLFSGSVFGQNNVTWEVLPTKNMYSSITILYQTNQGYLLAYSSGANKLLISKDKSLTWQELKNNTILLSSNLYRFQFVSDESNNAYYYNNKQIFKIDLVNNEIISYFTVQNDIKDLKFGHKNIYVLDLTGLSIYNQSDFQLLKDHAFSPGKYGSVILGFNNKNFIANNSSNNDWASFADNGMNLVEYPVTKFLFYLSDTKVLKSGKLINYSAPSIYFSDDDGLTWSKTSIPAESGQKLYVNTLNEIIVKKANSIEISKDEGKTWISNSNPMSSSYLFNNNPSDLILALPYCDNSNVSISLDKAKTWKKLNVNIDLPRSEKAKISYDEDVLTSTNCENWNQYLPENANSWENFNVNDTVSTFTAIITLKNGKWLAYNQDKSRNYISSDKGKTWSIYNKISVSKLYNNRIYQNYDGTLLANDGNVCLISSDEGETWTSKKTGNSYYFSEKFLLNNNYLFNTIYSGLAIGLEINDLTKQKRTFVTNFADLKYGQIKTGAKWIRNSFGFLVSGNGSFSNKSYLVISGNYGKTFIVKKIPDNILDMAIDKYGNIIALAQNDIYISLDEGDNWVSIKENIPNGLTFQFMAISANQKLYVGTDKGLIYKTQLAKYNINKIQGIVFLDKNKNCQKDANEPLLRNIEVKLNGKNNNIQLTNDNGFYKFNILEGTYSLKTAANTFTYETCAAEYPVTVNATKDSVNIDIPLKVVNLCASLNVTMTAPFLRRCFTNTYYGKICNDGSIDATNTKVEIVLDSLFDFESASLPIISQIGKTLILDAGTVKQGDCKDFFIKFKVSCNAKIGQEHCIKATVSSDDECNDQGKKGYGYVECLKNVGAFDPNDKAAFVNGKKEATLVKTGQKLEYLIRFQNTGTDTAFNIVVKDVIHANLDASSIEPGVASHKYNWEVRDNILYLNFNNIMLPDSNKSEMMSHGFVKFSIRPKANITTQDLITNTAGIYFDFNDAVITNEVVLNKKTSKTQDFALSDIDFSLFPNPTNESVQVEIPVLEAAFSSVFIYSIEGKLMQKERFQGKNTLLDVHALPSGLYILEIKNGMKKGTKKLIIQN